MLTGAMVVRIAAALSVLFVLVAGALGQSDTSEANALTIVKASAGAPPGLITWNGTDPCGSAWLGVQCTPANGNQTRYVTGLQLPGFGLKGSLSPALGLLPNLQILDLSQNQLEGGIPREFQNLTQLEQLDLHGNKLVATLNPWVGSMPRLVRMDLSRNSVLGPFPDDLFRLVGLQQLNLGGCLFTGLIPTAFVKLTNLRLLDLSLNYLNGPIPDALGQMAQLQALLLQNNSLTGTVPASLGNITNLHYLYLQGNNLTGPIPSNLTGLPSLVARYDGNPLCQQFDNAPLCTVSSQNTAQANFAPNIPLAPTTIAGAVQGGGPAGSLPSGGTPLGGMCVPGTSQVCRCADGSLGRGVCSGDGMAITGCGCNTGSSGGHGLNTTTVVVAVSVSVCLLALAAVGLCCAYIILRRQNKDVPFGKGAKTVSDDVEGGKVARKVPESSAPNSSIFKNFTPPKNPNTPRPPNNSASTRSVDLFGGSPHSRQLTLPRIASQAARGGYLLPYPRPPSSLRSSRESILLSIPGTPVSVASSRFASPFGGPEDEDRGSLFPFARSHVLSNPLYEGPRGTENPLFGVDPPEAPQGGDPRVFSFEELAAASENFSAERLLGGSGFGRVYLSAVEGRSVVVKRLNDLQTLGVLNKGPLKDRFDAEVGLMARLSHPHVNQLVGYCNQGKERCLVSPYQPNKCLHERLHGSRYSRPPLDWQQRLRIAAEAAAALAYLHQYGIVHRNFCASNLLLDGSERGVVSDFGLARLSVGAGAAAEEVTSLLVGASGYMAPEYGKRQGDVTEKADVYSFGVVLLELMTGRRALTADGTPLAHWAANYISKGRALVDSMLDPQIKGTWPSLAFFWTAELAGACIDAKPAARPDMADVEKALRFILEHAKGTMRDGAATAGAAAIGAAATGAKEQMRGHTRQPSTGSDLFDLPQAWNSSGEISPQPSTPDSDFTPSDTPRGSSPRSGESPRSVLPNNGPDRAPLVARKPRPGRLAVTMESVDLNRGRVSVRS